MRSFNVGQMIDRPLQQILARARRGERAGGV